MSVKRNKFHRTDEEYFRCLTYQSYLLLYNLSSKHSRKFYKYKFLFKIICVHLISLYLFHFVFLPFVCFYLVSVCFHFFSFRKQFLTDPHRNSLYLLSSLCDGIRSQHTYKLQTRNQAPFNLFPKELFIFFHKAPSCQWEQSITGVSSVW